MSNTLAIDGGTPVRTDPLPARSLIGREEKNAAMRVFDNAIASGDAFGYNGPFEKEYEQAFTDYMGGGFSDGVNSGTNALFCALGGLQIEPMSEIILPPITDAGGAMPAAMLACVPVFADAAPRTFNTSAAQIEPLITERTRAIVVAHLTGEPVDMDPVMALAEKHDLYVVEDCAQSHGATYKGTQVGTIGHIAAFSTMNGKHHCTGGQGGVVYTRDEALYWQAKRFADRGKPFNLDEPGNVTAGLNCNLNELSAAIGTAQLRRLPDIVAKRRALGEAVKARLRDRDIVSLGWQVPETECSYWWLRLELDLAAIRVDKKRFCDAVRTEGLDVDTSYHVALQADLPWVKNRAGLGTRGFPWTCSDYKGPREPQAHADNARRVIATNFRIRINEKYGEREADDIVAALTKVADAYRR